MNRYRFRSALLLAGAGLLSATSALAEGPGFYFGLNGGVSLFDVGSKAEADEMLLDQLEEVQLAALDLESTLDDSDQAWGVTVGYRWNPYVAAELSYVNFGETFYRADLVLTDGVVVAEEQFSQRLEASGATLGVLGMLPLGEQFDLHAIAGILFSDARFRTRIESESLPGGFLSEEHKSSEKEYFVGVGASWNINPSYSLRVQWQRYFNVGQGTMGEADIDLVMASVLFR
jgi:OmpA-OmpF porin, OOP family